MEENKREFAIDMDKIVNTVYNKIADWHNEDGITPEEKGLHLKFVSHEIVETVVTEAFRQLEGARIRAQIVPGTISVKKEEPKKGGGLFGGMLKGGKEK